MEYSRSLFFFFFWYFSWLNRRGKDHRGRLSFFQHISGNCSQQDLSLLLLLLSLAKVVLVLICQYKVPLGVWRKRTFLHCWWECKPVQPLWRTVWRFLKKLEIELLYDPAIPLLGIHTEETRIERDMYTLIFIAALFIIARTWKQPRCPSADECTRKLWCIYTMVHITQLLKRIHLNHF